jgi:glutaconyl-CoA/methylmalonyl-CoA decarboxylase subunit gamma
MKRYKVHINGKSYEVAIEELADGPSQPTAAPAPAAHAPANQPQPAKAAAPVAPQTPQSDTGSAAGTIRSPMPGTILRVAIAPGDKVKKGDTLLILEAMKMENEILAPDDGSIREVNVAKGASVNAGDLLLTMTS